MQHGPELPEKYRILPHCVALEVPGFVEWNGELVTLAPIEISSSKWFEAWKNRILSSRGSEYLPVSRMSDGEFKFLFGNQPPSERLDRMGRIRQRGRDAKALVRHRGKFFAATLPGVKSGTYTRSERRRAQVQYRADTRFVAENGILALHLSFGARPFQEGFFPQLGAFLSEEDIALSVDNYVPFYFVYALLSRHLEELVSGQRVVVVNAAYASKRQRITERLLQADARSVEWVAISEDRSLFDRIDLGRIDALEADVALVGAGIGKLRVLRQMKSLATPILDAGFMLEVFADPALAGSRPFTR